MQTTQKKAQELNTHLPTNRSVETESLSIRTQVKADDFELKIANLLFVRAEGNYVEIFYRSQAGVKKELKRITLTKLEAQLSVYPHVLRCHRAYLVNKNNIERISGNAQGYQLTFLGTSERALVSRNNMAAFNRLMR